MEPGEGAGCEKWAIAGVLCVLAAGMLVLAVDRWLGSPLTPPALRRHLSRAAAAVRSPARPGGGPQVVQVSVQGEAVEVPTGKEYPRAETVQVALELRRMGDDFRRRLLAATTGERVGLGDASPSREELDGLRSAADRALSRVEDYLAVERRQARVVLFCLGWPWLPAEGVGAPWSRLRARPLGIPWPLEGQRGKLHGARQVAEDAPAWPDAQRALRSSRGWSGNELEAFRAHICHHRVAEAFRSMGGEEAALRALRKFGILTRAQARAVLAMAGVRRLLGAGVRAVPPLTDLIVQYPSLARPVLEQIVREASIRRQASLAARRFISDGGAEARRELEALGPFAVAALGRLTERLRSGKGEKARTLLEELEEQWPAESSPLEVLGEDPKQWRRWYADARRVL